MCVLCQRKKRNAKDRKKGHTKKKRQPIRLYSRAIIMEKGPINKKRENSRGLFHLVPPMSSCLIKGCHE
jgi:hypothetical protein